MWHLAFLAKWLPFHTGSSWQQLKQQQIMAANESESLEKCATTTTTTINCHWDCYYIILRSISRLVIVRQGSIVGGDANWGNNQKCCPGNRLHDVVVVYIQCTLYTVIAANAAHIQLWFLVLFLFYLPAARHFWLMPRNLANFLGSQVWNSLLNLLCFWRRAT